MTNSTSVGRGRARARRALLTLTTALCTGLAAPTLAQTAPPPYNNVDEYGIDLTTGQYTFSMLEGSIGSGPGALALTRIWVGDLSVDNWSGGAYSTTENGVEVMKVEFGGVSDTFIVSGGTYSANYTAKKQDGATLVRTADGYLYRGRDGGEVEFASRMETSAGLSPVRGPSCRPQTAPGCSIPIRRRDPDGMTYTLDWDIDEACLITIGGECDTAVAHYRLLGVTSSAGYGMRVRYVSNNQGIGKNGPPSTWRQRSGVDFYNPSAAAGAQVSVN